MAELKKHNDKHQAYNFLEEYAEGRKILFAWVLRKVKIDNEPKPYFYSTGSWCSYDKKLSVKD